MEKKVWLTPPQIAALLGCGDDSVRSFINSGELRAVNTSLGDRPRWRISPEDFARFCESRSNKQAVEPERSRRSVPKASKKYI